MDEEGFSQTKHLVEEFSKEDGPKLYEELVEYAQDKKNYVEEFWNATYTNFTGPIMINVNPIFVLEDDPTPIRHHQIERASSLILSSLKFVKALRDESLSPDMWKKTPLCMSQFSKIFGSCRVPSKQKPGSDEIVTHDDGNHIVLISRGQLYYFQALTDENDIAVTEREIAKNLKIVIRDSAKLSEGEAASNALGVFTAGDRKTWANVRARLTDISEMNKRTIEVVDKVRHRLLPSSDCFVARHYSYFV